MKKTFNKSRPLSWSAISAFEYNKEGWYKKYVLGERDPVSKEMLFGKKLADALERGNCEIPELVSKLPYKKEHPFRVMFGDIPLVGYCDDFDSDNFKALNEVKTGKKEWTQKRADEHGQIDMYLLMNYITNKIRPDEVEVALHWLPTEESDDFKSINFVQPISVKTFKTVRTMAQILAFGQRINRVYKEMEDYCQNHE